MILPIYAALERLDPSLLEAAAVLGARPAARFWQVTLPISLPGVVAGCLLVFIPALGSFLPSDLLGGAKQMLIGNLIQNQFTAARNWPFGSAASLVVMVTVLVGVLAYLRTRDRPRRGRARWTDAALAQPWWRCNFSTSRSLSRWPSQRLGFGGMDRLVPDWYRLLLQRPDILAGLRSAPP
jgi:ABC-type Fe3+ transport system permease subunit